MISGARNYLVYMSGERCLVYLFKGFELSSESKEELNLLFFELSLSSVPDVVLFWDSFSLSSSDPL